jgi:hypothetical protein
MLELDIDTLIAEEKNIVGETYDQKIISFQFKVNSNDDPQSKNLSHKNV